MVPEASNLNMRYAIRTNTRKFMNQWDWGDNNNDNPIRCNKYKTERKLTIVIPMRGFWAIRKTH